MDSLWSEFLKCTTPVAQLNFLQNHEASEWNADELSMVAGVLIRGLSHDKVYNPEMLYSVMKSQLEHTVFAD